MSLSRGNVGKLRKWDINNVVKLYTEISQCDVKLENSMGALNGHQTLQIFAISKKKFTNILSNICESWHEFVMSQILSQISLNSKLHTLMNSFHICTRLFLREARGS